MQHEAEKLYEDFYHCLISKDSSGLQIILDNDFMLIHMTGMQQNSASFIRSVVSGQLNYYSAKTESVTVQTEKNTMYLIGHSVVSAAVFGGGQHIWRLQLKMQLVCHDNQWLISKTIASAY